jgi:thioredoxin reductase (NADPH)
VREGSIGVRWESRVRSIDREAVTLTSPHGDERLRADLVYVMTGFAPNTDLLRRVGVPIDQRTGVPAHNPETLETPVSYLFIAGVVVAGFDANKVFIENGRYHGDKIMARLLGRRAPAEPKLSAELDV